MNPESSASVLSVLLESPWSNFVISNETFQRKTFKTLGRIPNRKDSDYFDSYENLYWRPTPWYNQIFNWIYRFLYFITGPKFVVPILGFVIKRYKQYQQLSKTRLRHGYPI